MEKATRTRSKAACQFCRTRKLKCDNEQPECSACRSREIKCEYVVRTPAPRPSNAAIQALQAENKHLRRLLASSSIDASHVESEENADGQAETENDPNSPISTVSQQNTSSNQPNEPLPAPTIYTVPGVLTFPPQPRAVHSAMIARFGAQSEQVNTFNEAIRMVDSEPRRRDDESKCPLDATTKDVLRSQLVAASARQRQIEALPSSTQAYDYDGYEPELVHHLLNIHFNRQHHNLLLIYRPLFMRDFASGGHYYSKLLLNAIMFGSSKFSPRVDIRKDADRPSTAGWQFRQRFKNLLGEAMDESSITTIQALITVASSLFAIESAAKSTAWLYSGIAFRMIVDLGLHIDGAELLKNHRITAEDLEARRRVFWGAFVFDKIHSMYFGRPVTLQETNVRVPIEFFDDYEELEQWVPVELFNYSNSDYQRPTHPGGASHSVTTFSALCRLSLILGRITNEVYSESAYNHGGPISQDRSIRSLGTLSALDGHLQQWWSELPIEIRFEPWAIGIPLVLEDTPTPTILSLHCLYHICVILLHRPYLTKGHLFTAHHAQHALICCLVAAIRLAHVARAYCHAFTVRRTPYFIAYAAYVAITILLRVSAYQQPGSTPHQCVQYCLEILSASERTNAGVRKANSVVSKLIFVVNRKGPNPFPPGLSNPPWGQVLNERFDIDASSSFKIIDSFSLSSPDTTRQRSEWEPRVVESALNGQDSRLDHQSMELDHDSAAHLLASLRTNTPGMVDIPRDFVGHEVSTPFPDIIFGLHGDDAMQPWPEFNNHLENIYDWAPSGVMSEPAPTH